MADHDKDIDELIGFLALAQDARYTYSLFNDAGKWHAAMTALVAERNALREQLRLLNIDQCNTEAELAASTAESIDLFKQLVAMRQQRDEAHSLIRTWKVNLVDVVDDGEIMYAMTSDGRCSMDDAHKRAFLAATAKQGGGA